MWKEPWEDALENRKRKVSGCEESEDEHTEVLRKKRVTLGDKQKLNLSGVTEITSTKELENYLISHRDHFYYSLLSVTSMDAFYTFLFDSGWSDAILANFPTPTILDGIMQSEQELRDTALRKMLILLYFYHFYAQLRHNKCAALKCLPNPERGYRHCVDDLQNYSKYFSEFQKNLNLLLARCGFDGLYPRNPYDCLFLLAASSAHPLEALPAMLINGPPSAKPKEPKRTRAPKKQKSEA